MYFNLDFWVLSDAAVAGVNCWAWPQDAVVSGAVDEQPL
jgi:hypothetical protein